MTDPIKAAATAIKLLNLVELMLDMLEESGVALDEVVEMRARAKREGRDNLSDAEMAILANKARSAIDAIY